MALIRAGDRGGTEVWVYSSQIVSCEGAGLRWVEGWRSPNPPDSWWDTVAWSFIGHKLINPDTNVQVKAFFNDPKGYTYVGPDGKAIKHNHAGLNPMGSPAGKGPPVFQKVLSKSKGSQPKVKRGRWQPEPPSMPPLQPKPPSTPPSHKQVLEQQREEDSSSSAIGSQCRPKGYVIGRRP